MLNYIAYSWLTAGKQSLSYKSSTRVWNLSFFLHFFRSLMPQFSFVWNVCKEKSEGTSKSLSVFWGVLKPLLFPTRPDKIKS